MAIENSAPSTRPSSRPNETEEMVVISLCLITRSRTTMTATKVPRRIQRSMGISSAEGKSQLSSIPVQGQAAILHVPVRLKKPEIFILRIPIRHPGYIIADRALQGAVQGAARIPFGKL